MAWVRNGEHLFKYFCDCLGVFKVYRDCTGELEKYINYCKNIIYSIVLIGDTLHINLVCLTRNIKFRNIVVVSHKPTGRKLGKISALLFIEYS